MATADELPEGLRPTADDELRRARLVAMQRVATALLVVAAAAYAAALRWAPHYPWLAWVRAFSEAGSSACSGVSPGGNW